MNVLDTFYSYFMEGINWYKLAGIGLLSYMGTTLVLGGVRQYRKEYSMAKRARRRLVKSRIADAICNGIEDAIIRRHITSTEGEEWYHRLAMQNDLKDLIPGRLPAVELKKLILKRIEYLQGSSPMPFPKDRPVAPYKEPVVTDVLSHLNKLFEQLKNPQVL